MRISPTYRKQDGTLATRPRAYDGRQYITDREADIMAEKMVTRRMIANPTANESVVVEQVQDDLERDYAFTPEMDQRLEVVA